jgi:hypothetical protein
VRVSRRLASGRVVLILAWLAAAISLAVWSATVEETIFRMLPVCLFFALAQPVLRHAPAAAILAVLFSAATFGLAHGQTVGNLLGAGLGYGLPMAVVFVRRDWEHAVGAHYATDFAPWVDGAAGELIRRASRAPRIARCSIG